MNTKIATFGAGCFWGIENIFGQLAGVESTAVGYMGGTLEKPTYEDVCTNKSGHAEVVEVAYDTEKITYEKLLDVFWKNHNPTTMNSQGPDHGTQYRSAIFYHDEEQRLTAEKSKAEHGASGKWKDPIVTEITPATTFWRAEEYHQQYFAKRGIVGACHF